MIEQEAIEKLKKSSKQILNLFGTTKIEYENLNIHLNKFEDKTTKSFNHYATFYEQSKPMKMFSLEDIKEINNLEYTIELITEQYLKYIFVKITSNQRARNITKDVLDKIQENSHSINIIKDFIYESLVEVKEILETEIENKTVQHKDEDFEYWLKWRLRN